MRIDCHVHSYPLAIPGYCKGIFTPAYSGIKCNDLESILRKNEEKTGIMHGIFYGCNDHRTLPKKPKSKYLLKRVYQ